MSNWYEKLVNPKSKKAKQSWLRSVVTGTIFSRHAIQGDTSIKDIKTQIDVMRALARDSQISTALSYYATDATTPNTSNQIIWATPLENSDKEVAEIVNALFKKWNVASYARDHILELATIGNLYIPTSHLFREQASDRSGMKVVLDNNGFVDTEYRIVPSYKIPPEEVVHLWYQGEPQGYILQPEEELGGTYEILPESSIIHFSLGGLLGDYTITGINRDREEVVYDIQFAQPLMERAVQPTQTLTLLEDAMLLSSLTRVVKFINVDCGNSAEEDEVRDALQQIKDAIEQQLSINTNSGDAQSFVNPQSPNNLIYLPKINGIDPISVTDLNMAEATETDNKLLQYYQDKKLSVLGVPKEAMNFSSSEGLGNAGSVMSQRSALYANSLYRLETAYMEGWRAAMNQYFIQKNMSGFVDRFELHMNPIVTEMSSLQFDKRDAAISQAQLIVDIMKALGIEDRKDYREALSEILSEVLPKTGASVSGWKIEPTKGDEVDEIA